MSKHFDFRFLLLALVVNGGAVFFINLQEGGTSGASMSGVVQLFVSGGLAGFTIPYTKRNALAKYAWVAYAKGSIGMAFFVAGIGAVVHWTFHTPDLLGTIVWNFCLNAVAGVLIVYLKRTHARLPSLLRWIAAKL